MFAGVFFSFALSLVLMASAIGKLQGITDFRFSLGLSLRGRGRLRKAFIEYASWILPIVELALAFMLLTDWVREAAGLTLMLFATFSIFVWTRIRLGIDADCSCFGSALPSKYDSAALIRNFVLMLTTTLTLWLQDTSPAQQATHIIPERARQGVTAVSGALILGAVIMFLSWKGHSAFPRDSGPKSGDHLGSEAIELLQARLTRGVESIGLILFTSDTCTACHGTRQLLRDIDSVIQRDLSNRIVVIHESSVEADSSGRTFDQLTVRPGTASRVFGVLSTPTGVEIDDGVIAKDAMVGSILVEDRIRRHIVQS